MFSRGIALCSIFALTTVAQGGVQVQLVPTFCPGGGTCVANLCSGGTRNGLTCAPTTYPPSSVVQVDVKLSKTGGGSDELLRMVELDMTNTSASLTIVLPLTHDKGTPGTGDDVYFWSFSSLANCVSTPSFCGFRHFVDFSLLAGPVDTRLKMLSIAFHGLSAEGPAQILLPASGAPVTVGKLQVTMPGSAGNYTLNMMNPADAGADRGARVDFGFDPHIIWRDRAIPPDVVAQVTGGTFTFVVGDTPPTPVFVSSIPVHTAVGVQVAPNQGTLWRSAKNTLRLTFNGALSAAPTAGQILIQELLPAGAFGPNIAANGFTFLPENGNTVLRIRDDDATSDLGHFKWFAIRNTGGWTAAGNFEIHFPVQVGDSNGDGRTLFSDLGFINAQVPTSPAPDDARRDVNGDASILFSDLGAANARVPSDLVPKPTGH